MRRPSGEQITFEGAMSFAPLLTNESIIGGIFTFRGLRFLIYFAAEPPESLTLPGIGTKRMSEWEQGNPSYRRRRFRWRVGKHVSHWIDYVWPNE